MAQEIEIDAVAPRRCRVEGRIDIVGTRLEANHLDAAALERAEESKRHNRLAAAGPRGGYHEPAGHRRRLMRAPRGRSQAPGSRCSCGSPCTNDRAVTSS